jgi:hypothetical protein
MMKLPDTGGRRGLRRLALILALVAATATAACGGGDDTTSTAPTAVVTLPSIIATPTAAPPAAASFGTFTFVGFADHAGPNNHAPNDVTATGGTIRACKPQELFAFVNFTGLTPPKTMNGTWTWNGTLIGRQTLNQTEREASTFWRLQAMPVELGAGAYVFTISIDGTEVSRGQFTLTC